MKHRTLKLTRLLFLFISFFYVLNTYAQVTIGSNLEPQKGALLQLKETDESVNSNKGLLLPRVNLEGVFDPKIGGVTDFTSSKDDHTGLWVYNLYDNTAIVTNPEEYLCAGPYVWNGGKWIRLLKPCIPPYAGKVHCENNIADIVVGVCRELNRLGSFQLSAYENASITIKNNDILGQIGNYQIVAIKDSSNGDSDTYVVTKDNSPVDINVVIKGPASNIEQTVIIPIDISSKINGGPSVLIEGCPYSKVTITTDYLITDPTTVIFTSGLDGLSRGYQDFKTDNNYFTVSPAAAALPSFVENDYLVRPWGIAGVKYQGKSGSSIIGDPSKFLIHENTNYWPFVVSWQPQTSDVKVVNAATPAPAKYKEPNFTLVYDGLNLPKPNPLNPDACGYISYQTKAEQTGSSLVWEEFIKMTPINQAPIFQDNIETFIINKPYALSKEVTLQQSTGGTANFDVRQIHYGTQILDLNDTPIEGILGQPLKINGYNPVEKNYEFKFKIRSNVKWSCTLLEVSYLNSLGSDMTPGRYWLNSSVNLSATGPMSFGPEEDAYGEPREREVTLRFKKPGEDGAPTIPPGGMINILIQLDDPKLINSFYTGREFLSIQLIND
ncbi:hypothetical protein JGH11_17940 [Dysgonomonas sp. Marseille-P4677]|uniref:hypothetical protein n=1 Tax=Dysgonomonas sp. Marseille-P4677 TaxID=2364790 RepID=UPI0019137818|nr:hypothetical protein [Dysgonomonas sp. Marseille-P4677]MBK5722755.1 hypothetical protein [Dysgonomonas sp. Marseille-P4677]